MTIPSVISVEQTGPYRLRLRFDDGAEGEVDIQSTTPFEGVFEPLIDPVFFSQVRVDDDAGTIVWPNGADLDPVWSKNTNDAQSALERNEIGVPRPGIRTR